MENDIKRAPFINLVDRFIIKRPISRIFLQINFHSLSDNSNVLFLTIGLA